MVRSPNRKNVGVATSVEQGVFRESPVIQYNPQSIFTGTYIQQVLQSFSASSSSSEEEEVDDDNGAARHRMLPHAQFHLQRIGSEASADDGFDSSAEEEDVASFLATASCYIFMDTEEEEDDAVAIAGKQGSQDDRNMRANAFVTPLAQSSLLREYSSRPALHHPGTHDAPNERHLVLSPMKQAMRSVWGGFSKRMTTTTQRYTASTSPLDDAMYQKKHRISDLAVQAIADTCPNIHSASFTRNHLVDFAFWEQALLHPPADAGTAETSTSSTVLDDENDEEEPSGAAVLKAVSMMDGTTAVAAPSLPSWNATHYDSILEEFDALSRSSSEEVAAALRIESQGRAVLSLIRGRTGMVEDLSLDPCTIDRATTMMMIPWIHIIDDLWIPHYEEYVIRAVHAFSRQLLSFHVPKKPRPVV